SFHSCFDRILGFFRLVYQASSVKKPFFHVDIAMNWVRRYRNSLPGTGFRMTYNKGARIPVFERRQG
ncbi:MAG TPA: hypothetical protein PK763_03370, partial [Anaerolineaceae bacterium]|nr:hypothetical protein [Anaerolineaceae bacterium]